VNTLETVCVCLGIVCACLSVATVALASIVPFLYHRLRKAEDKIDVLDQAVEEVCKAGGLGGKQ